LEKEMEFAASTRPQIKIIQKWKRQRPEHKDTKNLQQNQAGFLA
jgi:hypothetical protein